MCGALFVWTVLSSAGSDASAPVQSTAVPDATHAAKTQQVPVSIEAIAAIDPFDPLRGERAAVVAQSAGELHEEASSNTTLELLGTVVDAGGDSFAMIRVGGDSAAIVRQQQVVRGYRLTSIGQGRARFVGPDGAAVDLTVSRADRAEK